ncbi:hypothetical protein [Olivibacter sitiensis]|uniref:hypothetical protein n=1 Tax=Olivibacter sitiensis TaxID=376470 RepID=UPI00042453E7|nr:hypothetical protein [Olivibacter sitiensis]
MRKLTAHQIEELKSFISKRGFVYTDVQLEILDHFACKVEEKMNLNTNLGFEDAMTAAHRDFGVMGFAPIEDAIGKDITNRLKREARQVLKHWFTSARVLLVLFFLFLSSKFYLLIAKPTLCLVMLFAAYLCCLIYFLISIYRDQYRFKNMLAYRVAGSFIGAMAAWPIFLLNCYQMIGRASWSDNPLMALLFAILLIIQVLFFVVMWRFYRETKARCDELGRIYGTSQATQR